MENCYDFTFKRAFSAIDDWRYGYVDASNIKRFLNKHGYSANRKDLVAVLRRLDVDGDCRVDFDEFQKGLRSSLTVFGSASGKAFKKTTTSLLIGRTHAKQASCERLQSARRVQSSRRSFGDSLTNRVANSRRRETELQKAQSKSLVGPCSKYYLTCPQKFEPSKTSKQKSSSSGLKLHKAPTTKALLKMKKSLNRDILTPPQKEFMHKTVRGSPMRRMQSPALSTRRRSSHGTSRGGE